MKKTDSTEMNPTPLLGHYIGGKQVESKADTWSPVHNPSTGEVIARTPAAGADETAQGIESAQKALRDWSTKPAPGRAALFFAYKNLLETHQDELARLITRENGKTLDEARGDVRRGIEVVDFACGIAHLAKGESLPQIAEGIDAVSMREPIGVCAGITPFNFPAMVPLWMFPLAIACGNTFVLKPSEKTPMTALRLAELFREAGFPDGVLNVILGGREAVDTLCAHPTVAAVSFVGSSTVAQHVYQRACSHGKRCQSAGGAKNVLLVMPDADPDSTLRAILGSAYGCAGQRCMAGSVFMGIGQDTSDHWRLRISGALESLRIDNTSKVEEAEMGPVIDEGARERIEQTIAKAKNGDAEVAFRRSSGLPENGFFTAPAILDQVNPDSGLFNTEIFGPVLSMVRAETLDEAISAMNRTGYGNGATIFTSSGSAAREFTRKIQCGMVGVNVGVPAPMAPFSFSGWNQSFFGDLHVQGMEGVMFYTRQRVVLSRWDNAYIRKQGW